LDIERQHSGNQPISGSGGGYRSAGVHREQTIRSGSGGY